MNSLNIICLVLLSSGFALSLKEPLGSNHILPSGPCDSSHTVGKNFEFNFNGAVTHTDAKGQTTGIQIQCQKSVITTVAACAARMKLDACRLFEGKNGRLSPASRLAQRRVRKLIRYPIYFNTNGGENTKVYVHQNDDEFQVNIKKGILSALSLNTANLPGVGGSATHTTNSIFGETETEVRRTAGNSVQTIRNLKGEMADSMFSLPILSHFPKVAQQVNAYASLYLSPVGTQTCDYSLFNGNVKAVSCKESRKTVGAIAALAGMGAEAVDGIMETVVTQTVKFTKVSNAGNTLPSSEIAAINKGFVSDSPAFTNTLDQLDSMISRSGFQDAVNIMGSLESDGVNAAAMGNLEMWMAAQSEGTMSKLMNSVGAGNQFWSTLISGCLNLRWCKGENCQPSPGCQKVLGDMIVSSGDGKLLALAAGLEHPTAHLLQSVLTLASGSPTASNVLALGKVMNQFMQSGNSDGGAAQAFLEGQIRSGCASSGSSDVLVSAIKSVAAVEGRNLEQFASCLRSSDVGDNAKMALVQALNSQKTISNSQARSALMAVLADSSRTVKLRVASFVALIMNNPSSSEVARIVAIAHDSSESMLFTHCLNAFMDGQVTVKDTNFQVLADSTIAALASHGIEATQELNYYNYAKSDTVPIPKVPGKSVNVNVNVDTYTAADKLIPTIIDVTVGLQAPEFNAPNAIELRIDNGRLLPIVNALLESDMYIIHNALGHLLRLPLKQWVPYLMRNSGFLEKNIMDNLALLQEKFSLVEEMNSINSSPFFDLKVMGQRLTGANFASGKKSSPIAKALEMMKIAEEGVEFDTVAAGNPFVYQHSVPTSLGTPLVSYFKMNSAAKMAGNWIWQKSKTYLTGSGEIGGMYNIDLTANVAVGQTASIMRDVGCGSEVQAEFNIKDSGEARMVRTPTMASFMGRMPEDSSATVRILEVKNAWSSLTGDVLAVTGSGCSKTDTYNNDDVVTTICFGPSGLPREAKVVYSGDGSTYKLVIDAADRTIDGNTVKGFVVAVTQTPAGGATNTLVGFNSDYVEADSSLNFHMEGAGQTVGFKSTVTHSEDEDEESSEFDLKIFMNEAQVVRTTFTIEKEDAEAGGVWSWFGSDETSEVADAKNYRFSGYMSYLEAELSFEGSMESPDERGEFEATLEVYLGSVLSVKLFEIDWANQVVEFDNGVQGNNVSIVLSGLSAPAPFTSAGLSLFRSSGNFNYDLLKITAFPTDGPAFFIDLRQVHHSSGVNNFDFRSVVTGPRFQSQLYVDGTDANVFSINHRTLIFSNTSKYAYEDTLAAEDSGSTKLAVNDPLVQQQHGFDLSFTQGTDMAVEYTQIVNGLETISFVHTFDKTCKACSKTVVQTMNVEGVEDTYFSFEKMPSGLSIVAKVPPFLPQLEIGANAVETAHGVSLRTNFNAPMIGSCSASATYEVEGNTARGFRNVSCDSPMIGTFSNDFGMTYTFETNHDYWAFDSSISSGRWQMDTMASFDISGVNKVMQNVATHRQLDLTTRRGGKQSASADLSLDYNARSLTSASVAPYTLTMSSSGGQSHSVDLFSRNGLIMEDFLTNVCGKSQSCRKQKIDAQLTSYTGALSDVEAAFSSIEAEFDGIIDPALDRLSTKNEMAANFLRKTKLGQAFFRGGVPFWTMVPPTILVNSLPDIHNSFGTARDAMQSAVQVGPQQRFNFRIRPLKQGMLDAINRMYTARDAATNVLTHPTYLSQNADAAQKALASAFSNMKIGYSKANSPHTAVAFAPKNGGALNLITFNSNNRAIPYGPDSCTWVAVADLNGGATSFVTGNALIITLLDEVMKVGSDGAVSLYSDGSWSQQSAPFKFSMMQCSMGDGFVLNCRGLHSNVKVFYKGGVMAWYTDLERINGWNGHNFRGLLGNPGAESARLMPQMAHHSTSEVNFINAYELTKNPQCVHTRDATTRKIKRACRKAFQPYANQVSPKELNAYMRACSAHANNAGKAAVYTDMLDTVLESR